MRIESMQSVRVYLQLPVCFNNPNAKTCLFLLTGTLFPSGIGVVFGRDVFATPPSKNTVRTSVLDPGCCQLR